MQCFLRCSVLLQSIHDLQLHLRLGQFPYIPDGDFRRLRTYRATLSQTLLAMQTQSLECHRSANVFQTHVLCPWFSEATSRNCFKRKGQIMSRATGHIQPDPSWKIGSPGAPTSPRDKFVCLAAGLTRNSLRQERFILAKPVHIVKLVHQQLQEEAL